MRILCILCFYVASLHFFIHHTPRFPLSTWHFLLKFIAPHSSCRRCTQRLYSALSTRHFPLSTKTSFRTFHSTLSTWHFPLLVPRLSFLASLSSLITNHSSLITFHLALSTHHPALSTFHLALSTSYSSIVSSIL